jgi:hypothetical protein
MLQRFAIVIHAQTKQQYTLPFLLVEKRQKMWNEREVD